MARIYAATPAGHMGPGIRSAQKLAGELKAIDDRLRFLGFDVGKLFWELHHVKPICLGGRNAMDNYATICRPCHKEENAILAGQLARRPAKRLMVIGEDREGRPKVY